MARFDLPDVDAVRIGDRQTVLSQSLEVRGNRLSSEWLGVCARRAGAGL